MLFNAACMFLWPPCIAGCGHTYFHPVVSSFILFFFISSPNLSGRTLDVYHTSTHGVALVRIYSCMSGMCCTRLAENTGRKNDAKTRHLGTIAQLCRVISLQLRHVSTIGKKTCYTEISPHMSLQYGELRPISGWDRFVSLGHPSKFQRLSRLRSFVIARYFSSGRQPNFAVLNRGRHLYSAGRPSLWASAHILVSICFTLFL